MRRKAFPEREGIILQQIKTSEAQLSNHDSICNFWLLLHLQSSIRLSLFNGLNNSKIVGLNLSRMLFLFVENMKKWRNIDVNLKHQNRKKNSHHQSPPRTHQDQEEENLQLLSGEERSRRKIETNYMNSWRQENKRAYKGRGTIQGLLPRPVPPRERKLSRPSLERFAKSQLVQKCSRWSKISPEVVGLI